ncbi:probable 1-deoxy-D-xylulose-5-phosphate synthase, chloroplastic isoform X1 [Zingiber officinale]|uniref:probable 1-deoxy-D-xylulose-5-phosphate synthase, chloroplastic isoform X1 n=1 Tax=Zingiber officinale TaxID=94328 RepID=UPI001C4B87C0|nr:probable 1-deoxy-D-xylulose-5-phosphate synthase, chloroplastic isoform X1 [Zingiber officinale]XP_042407680.1 probable 1-deoxy-D-xylulose-5-phosphate synthase, chloroplastic isoform X1 [Zingiber officinale]XP_042407681.1 probable 1-deoxy-D-xylulose-5-phosphate synthase, chloroplastic isoform X1 [Zingiber officinale]
MASSSCQCLFGHRPFFHGESRFQSKTDLFSSTQPFTLEFIMNQNSVTTYPQKSLCSQVAALPDLGEFFWEKDPTPILDMVDTPIQLKNLSCKELKQLASEIRSEISFIMSNAHKPYKASLSVVELTVAIHHVFHAPMDKILWDDGEQVLCISLLTKTDANFKGPIYHATFFILNIFFHQIQTYAHKILTGRRALMHTLKQRKGLSGFTSRAESDYDAFGAGHGCNSISAGLGMAVARDIQGKKNRVVAIINNLTTMAGQVYEAMSNAGYLDSNMIVILNDSRHSLHPKLDDGSKMAINPLSSSLSKLQSSRSFRRFREAAKGITKRIGKAVHELAAKVDEYTRGMMGPLGATLFEELGLYYIGPVDGHNIDDLVCVLNEVASLDSTGPVLVHVITEDEKDSESTEEGTPKSCSLVSDCMSIKSSLRTFNDVLVEALVAEAERDKSIVVVHAGTGLDPSIKFFQTRFPDRFFDVGMAEQHAITFSAGLSCGGMKPFCIIPSTFLQRGYDQVIEDVDLQKVPVRFAISSAGLVGSEGPTQSGIFDIAFMACLPNMIVMAPSDEDELVDMVATAVLVDDRPICFRYPRIALFGNGSSLRNGTPLEIGKGEILVEGKHVALLGYGVMVQNCIKAQSLLASLGIEVTVASARFCKPLDIELIRELCQDHQFLITVEEGTIGGFGTHVSQFLALDGLLDGRVMWRPVLLPDNYIEHASPREQLDIAGLTGHHIAATALSLLGRYREAFSLMH